MGTEQARRVVLVTGGNSGIGFQCARRLAREDLGVLIASRNEELSREAVERIRGETGNDAVEAMPLDLGSLAAVRQFAKELRARELPLDALVLNAGVQLQRGPRYSADGYETSFAVNHLGHFLRSELLPRRSDPPCSARALTVPWAPRTLPGGPKA